METKVQKSSEVSSLREKARAFIKQGEKNARLLQQSFMDPFKSESPCIAPAQA
jgi:hypothetical protein